MDIGSIGSVDSIGSTDNDYMDRKREETIEAIFQDLKMKFKNCVMMSDEMLYKMSVDAVSEYFKDDTTNKDELPEQRLSYYFETDTMYIKSSKCMEHLSYIHQSFEEDDYSEQERRFKYTDEINRWLKCYCITDVGRYFDNMDEDYIHCLNPLTDEVANTKNEFHVRNVYDSVMELLKNCKLELIDENQFKEDLIYFMYKFSDIYRIKNA